MKTKPLLLLSLLFSLSVLSSVFAQNADKKTDEKPVVSPVPAPVETKGQATVNGKTFGYTTRTGYLTLKDESGKPKANVFFIYYTRDGVADLAKRPVTYTFNGGPGSASVWLHMGCIGPKRIPMTDKGEALKPPYGYVNNEYSWLDKTDLCFIDPVNTGYSRAVTGENEKQFLGYVEDIESVGEFIRLHATKYGRWASPKFLAGESYGTTRAAGLAGFLQDRYNLYINGVV